MDCPVRRVLNDSVHLVFLGRPITTLHRHFHLSLSLTAWLLPHTLCLVNQHSFTHDLLHAGRGGSSTRWRDHVVNRLTDCIKVMSSDVAQSAVVTPTRKSKHTSPPPDTRPVTETQLTCDCWTTKQRDQHSATQQTTRHKILQNTILLDKHYF